MNAIRSQASRCVRECTLHSSHEQIKPVARPGLPLLTQETHWVGRHHVTECLFSCPGSTTVYYSG